MSEKVCEKVCNVIQKLKMSCLTILPNGALNAIVYVAQIDLRWPTFGPNGTSLGTKCLGVEGGFKFRGTVRRSFLINIYIYIYI